MTKYVKKLSTPIEVLCKSHPVELASYLHYCHSLTFDQRPDCGFLKRLFRDLFQHEVAGCEFDYIFDWTIIKYQQAQKNKSQTRSSQPVPTAINTVPTDMDAHPGSNNALYSSEVLRSAGPTRHVQIKSTMGRTMTSENQVVSDAPHLPTHQFVHSCWDLKKIMSRNQSMLDKPAHGRQSSKVGSSNGWLSSFQHIHSAK